MTARRAPAARGLAAKAAGRAAGAERGRRGAQTDARRLPGGRHVRRRLSHAARRRAPRWRRGCRASRPCARASTPPTATARARSTLRARALTSVLIVRELDAGANIAVGDARRPRVLVDGELRRAGRVSSRPRPPAGTRARRGRGRRRRARRRVRRCQAGVRTEGVRRHSRRHRGPRSSGAKAAAKLGAAPRRAGAPAARARRRRPPADGRTTRTIGERRAITFFCPQSTGPTSRRA